MPDKEPKAYDEESMGSLTDMMNSIDDLSKSLEMQRKIFDAREQLQQMCFALGIKKDDQDLLDEKFQSGYTKADIEDIAKTEETLDKKFFTREDGSIIHVTTIPGENQYQTKKELVIYLNEFYDMERSVKKELDEMNKDISKFKKEDVASASATVANNLKAGIAERRAELDQLNDDDPNKRQRMKLLARLESAYTFQTLLDLMEKYPNTVVNAAKDFKKEVRIKDIGKRYADKLHQVNTFSTLYGIIADDISKSIEAQFLHEDDYAKSYENFFGFFLIRFFATESWTSKDDYTKELHNATSIVLSNLVSGNLDIKFRDELVENIKKVWNKAMELGVK